MAFQGSLKELPLPDIIQLVSVSGKTGVFELRRLRYLDGVAIALDVSAKRLRSSRLAAPFHGARSSDAVTDLLDPAFVEAFDFYTGLVTEGTAVQSADIGAGSGYLVYKDLTKPALPRRLLPRDPRPTGRAVRARRAGAAGRLRPVRPARRAHGRSDS